MDTLHSPDAFYLSLDEAPNDFATLLVLADWYDEQGNEATAACLRWTSRRGLVPFRYQRQRSGLTTEGSSWQDNWLWWCFDDPRGVQDWGQPRSCRLPRALWVLLNHHFPYTPAVFKEYPSRREAYEALFAAWPIFAPHNRVRSQERPR